MPIVRHDWYGAEIGVSCEDTHYTGRQVVWERTPPADCHGCSAVITDYRFNEVNLATEDGQDALDRLWHEELRPMAALVCLVEEAKEKHDTQ